MDSLGRPLASTDELLTSGYALPAGWQWFPGDRTLSHNSGDREGEPTRTTGVDLSAGRSA
jgi:hypothetical protein